MVGEWPTITRHSLNNAQMCWPATPERPLERKNFSATQQKLSPPANDPVTTPPPALGSIPSPWYIAVDNALFLTISRQVKGSWRSGSIDRPAQRVVRPENEVVFVANIKAKSTQ